MPAEPYGAAETGPTGVPVAQRVARQVGGEVGADRDGPDAGAATAVRDAERLVQVQVGHVGAELTRLGQPDQRVEVGPVDVHLAAGVVHLGADLGDRSPRRRRASTGR